MDIKLIECQYGKHNVPENEFTKSGLKMKLRTCRACKAESMRRYRLKHKEKYNDSIRDSRRIYMAEYRKIKKNIKIKENDLKKCNVER